uniref:Uncharacterized protein n=1 Tax=Ixodes ricinus TaxID=34613 RepID=A0A6B0UV76_IXORI
MRATLASWAMRRLRLGRPGFLSGDGCFWLRCSAATEAVGEITLGLFTSSDASLPSFFPSSSSASSSLNCGWVTSGVQRRHSGSRTILRSLPEFTLAMCSPRTRLSIRIISRFFSVGCFLNMLRCCNVVAMSWMFKPVDVDKHWMDIWLSL